MKTLELLAPAKNLECGIAAIEHGADAVYIGAPRFGARSAAGNSLEDIRQLCDFAHQYGAKVHVTVNTIVYDGELEDTLEMIAELDKIGVDAILLQDMGVLSEIKAKNAWRRELHASTQCDTRTREKAEWLHGQGFCRVVLARELSLDEIQAVHRHNPGLALEVFVHGALCVSYSGVCYASEKCFGRSANRGECAQFCRMKFDLLDSNGEEIEHQRYLLSLKDLCQIRHLRELADAGASSFKIEGRLKDIYYVKNVVAAYNQALDQLVATYPKEYRRASRGHVECKFEPNLKKTFNRGYTNYFLKGRQPDIASFDTPKAMGEYVGKVKEIRGSISFNVSTVTSFANGDGLCFINDDHELEGFRVNRVEGNRLFPFRMPGHLRPGMALYRNNDRRFEAILSRPTAERRIPVLIAFKPANDKAGNEVKEGILATLYLPASISDRHVVKGVEIFQEFPLEPARRSQRDNIIAQMSKLGETKYECREVRLEGGIERYFIPNSILASLRRKLIDKMDEKMLESLREPGLQDVENAIYDNGYGFSVANERRLDAWQLAWTPEYAKWAYLYNIANSSAKAFYEAHGLEHPSPAFEIGKEISSEWSAADARGELLIMQCRHCIRYSLGYCVKRGGRRPAWKEPLYLRLGDGRRFRLEFACNECQMNVYSVESE